MAERKERGRKKRRKTRLKEILALSPYEGIARVGQQINRLTVNRAPKDHRRWMTTAASETDSEGRDKQKEKRRGERKEKIEIAVEE